MVSECRCKEGRLAQCSRNDEGDKSRSKDIQDRMDQNIEKARIQPVYTIGLKQ